MANPQPVRLSTSGNSDTEEDEALALHRLDTGPRSRLQQSVDLEKRAHHVDTADVVFDAEVKYGPRHDEGVARGLDAFDEDEEAFLGVARNRPEPQPVLDKTGRPEWLQDGIQITRTSRRVRLLLTLGTLLLLGCIFGFVFAGTGTHTDASGRLEKIYTWAGNVWHSGSGVALATSREADLFPIDVGYPGPTQKGKPANLASEDASRGEPARGNSPLVLPVIGNYKPFSHMGCLTPYRSADDFSVPSSQYRALPKRCSVERVHILHRHGSRYPTTHSPANDVRKMIKDVQKSGKRFTGDMASLNDYDTDRLGLEVLVPVGRQQLFDSGVQHGMEYGHLIDGDLQEHGRLFVRSGSQHRIVESTTSFLQGVFGTDWHNKTNIEVQIEAAGFNTTLAPNFACPNAGKDGMEPGFAWANQWSDDYLRGAIARLQPLAPGTKLTGKLVNGMQQLCSYDTVAFGHSDFCTLFTEQEWRDYEYFWDLEFYGGYGDGSPVGKAQGLGWVNEMMSRLTRTPWDASQQTTENATLNSNPVTFPVDRRFYADFTHDSTIAGVIAALNLADFIPTLPVHAPDANRKYRTTNIVPFGARLVLEEISCDTSSVQRDDRVRLLLNEAIIDLAQLQGCTPKKDGTCARAEFIKAMEGRQQWSDWHNCTKAL